ncbi:hypothetical protein TREES_T100020872 [Tupaia chinensis]|uniref:Uncharacterized protein n=1 Tax=Tupaia chinensis TaxID=246437 RepID=L9JNF6_TUPCH|nr:hypothetical protein TREES_T100020872 [Tupaia chinensis]
MEDLLVLGGHDPTSPQSPGSSSPWHDVSTPYGEPFHDANDGPSSSWDDASRTYLLLATHGRPHAHNAWAPDNEISCLAHDGAH